MSERAQKLIEAADSARRESFALERDQARERLLQARDELLEAIVRCRDEGAGGDWLPAVQKLGQIERDLGHGDAARACYQEVVDGYRQRGDPPALAHAVRHLGDVHREAGRLDRAEACCREALAIYRDDADTHPLDLANAIRSLALACEARGEADEAKRRWEQARKLYADMGVIEGVDECSDRLVGLRP